jgi:DmsE family decaheme c-type cytochrome
MHLLNRAMVLLGLIFAIFAGSAAAADTPEPDRTLKGDAVCTRCHDESESKPILSMYKTPHGVKADGRTPGCQSCHGASEAHVKNPNGSSVRPLVDIDFGSKSKTPTHAQADTCLSCHKSGQRAHWTGSEHERRDVPCSSCHAVHKAQDPVLSKATQPEVCFACHQTQRAQIHRLSTHPIAAGKMACTDCHNPHGSVGPKLMTKNSINETCFTCHADRRGPFLWEHSPVSDDCTNCHTPHGSVNQSLLKQRTPWLCQDCHSTDHSGPVNSGANLPGGAATTIKGRLPIANQAPKTQMNGRNCLSCHAMIHGSNHPAGARFQR